MRRRSVALLPLATVVPALLAGCVMPYIGAEDRKEACQVAVVEKYGRAEFQPSSLSGGAGPAAGAGKGALIGLQAGGGGLGSILLAPIGAVLGAGYGTACKAPRPECTRPAAASPDALLEIEKVEAGMACLMGRQEFWIAHPAEARAEIEHLITQVADAMAMQFVSLDEPTKQGHLLEPALREERLKAS